jgi:hypothetical protein
MREIAPIIQDKSGSSDPIETGGFQSVYRGSEFRETRSLPFVAVEIVDRRNAESTFEAEPMVLALSHFKRACKRGRLPFKYRIPPRPFILRTRGARSSRVGVSTFGSSRGESFMLFYISKPRTPIAPKAPKVGPVVSRSIFSRPSKGDTWRQTEPSRCFAHRDSKAQRAAPLYSDA